MTDYCECYLLDKRIRNGLMHTIIGIFDTPRRAQRAMEMLRASHLSLEDVSIISRTGDHSVAVDGGDDVSASEGATVGAVWGGVVGLVSLVIPGVGPIIAGGALAAAVASAITGAVTGAVVGGVAAALIHFGGISEDEARQYEALVHDGKTLVAVKASDEATRHVRRVLTKAGAESVQGDSSVAVGEPHTPVQIGTYDERGKRVDLENEPWLQDTPASSLGRDELSSTGGHTP
jgi:uncharacterized membrane protein